MKTQYIIIFIVSIILGGIGGCVQETVVSSDEPECGVMPLKGDDVLWISSIPLGADVFLIKDDDLQMPADPNTTKEGLSITPQLVETLQHETGPFSQASVGRTPLVLNVPDGNYTVGVQLNVSGHNIVWRCAAQTKKKDSSETDSLVEDLFKNMEIQDSYPEGGMGVPESYTGCLSDGNQELWVIITDGLVRKIGKTYTVKKKSGETATVIALFQHQNEDSKHLYEALPTDYKFRWRRDVIPSSHAFGVPWSKCMKFREMLMRGGKAIYLGKKRRVMFELVPLDNAIPSKRRTGGYTIRFIEVPAKCDK